MTVTLEQQRGQVDYAKAAIKEYESNPTVEAYKLLRFRLWCYFGDLTAEKFEGYGEKQFGLPR
jgi:hypothetical protein